MAATGRGRVRALALAVLVAGGLVQAAAPAAASCVAPPPKDQAVAEADTVFSGTVESVRADGFIATVRVDEVWKGGVLPEVVEVHGGAGGDRVTSIDRTFTAGTRYLFFPTNDQPPFQDNWCTPTEEWQDEFGQHRPDTAREPATEEDAMDGEPASSRDDGMLDPSLLGLVAVALLALGGAGWWARRNA